MFPIIDIHSHILPQIDDGSKSMEQSTDMLSCAYENGVEAIIVTPHYKPQHHNASKEKIDRLIESLTKIGTDMGTFVKLYPGNELLYQGSIAEELDAKKVYTLAGSRYALVEFNPMDSYERIRDGIYNVLSYGYLPILAHVERYQNVVLRFERAEELVSLGCYLQVNAGSVMGEFGLSTKGYTKKLLKKELVSFVASDAHDMKKRSPKLRPCANYISKKYGADTAVRLFYDNPKMIIEDEIV